MTRTPPALTNKHGFETGSSEAKVLSQAYSYREIDLRRAGVNVDIPGLIKLDNRLDGYVVPAFQFDDEMVVRPVVLQINRQMMSQLTPEHALAAAKWWLDYNPKLDNAPADIVGLVADDRLLDVFRTDARASKS